MNVGNRFQTCGIGSELEKLAVGDVAPAVDAVCDTFGIEVFSAGGPDFVAVCDHEGLLIVVHEHRVWFPTSATTPSGQPLTVTLAVAGSTRSIRLGRTTVVGS
ncbi:MAG: hypothetical protein ACR2I1_10395 [Propionibacteriaceae bacterium]